MNDLAARAAKTPHSTTPARVIVADDEESMRYFVTRALRRDGFDVVDVEDGERALAQFDRQRADVVVIDLKMPGIDGLEVLRNLRKRDPDVVVIVMTAFGTVATAVEAMRGGAHDYITKPFESGELLLIIQRALDHRATVRENRDLRLMVDHRTCYGGLVGQSPAMRAVFQSIDLVLQSDATVLITGESGTGKELVARAIHAGTPHRQKGPFLPIHCPALKDSLVESELFGHEPGAFTGAVKHKDGLLVRASGGTLFLDEITETSGPTQAKIERFLQAREITPLGGTQPIAIDTRVVAAANRDVERLVADGTFRQELFFRLNVVRIDLPPLRERREDVPALASRFLERFAASNKTDAKRLTVDAVIALTNYDWPGNIRELENVIERLVVMNTSKETLSVEDLPAELRAIAPALTSSIAGRAPASYEHAITAAERAYLADLLRTTSGNVTEAARLAELSRGHLHRKLASLDLDPAAFRRE